MSTLQTRKASLRTELLARRRSIAPGARAAATEAIARRVGHWIGLPPPAVVAGYWPLADELDPRPCLERLAARGHRLALPRMQGASRPLVFHLWRPGEPLAQGAFQVMEPRATAPPVRPDLVLVPLLAFDRRGHRLGYGKGYYDRTLRALRAAVPTTLALGLAFAAQEVAEVPSGPSDEPLDGVVTEAALVSCSARLAPSPGEAAS